MTEFSSKKRDKLTFALLNDKYNTIYIYYLMQHFIKKEFDIHEDALLLWRKRIFFTIFLIAILVAALSYIPNMKISFQSGKWLNALVYTIIYLIGITVTFVRVIPFKLRAWSGLFYFIP